MHVARSLAATFVSLLTEPPTWLRAAAAALLVTLIASLFHFGAQPYAVGLIPAPWDKLAHLAFFGGVAGLASIALGGRGPVVAFAAFGIAVAVGGADEAVQTLLPGRNAGLADLAADLAGAALALLLLGALRGRRMRAA
ncbi:MAG TPA: VanZ family protein [Burkholderiaceae bacterium]|nr:VanZ family protein [Burkholderiaceae bacterium]